MLSDLDYVVSLESDVANLPFITPWERMQHEGAIRFPDSRHFIVERDDLPGSTAGNSRIGYGDPRRAAATRHWLDRDETPGAADQGPGPGPHLRALS